MPLRVMPGWMAYSKSALGIVGLVVIAAGFTYGYLDNEYVTYSRRPEPETGRTVPYEVKGIVVFISPRQRSVISVLRWTLAAGGVVAVACLVAKGRMRSGPSPS